MTENSSHASFLLFRDSAQKALNKEVEENLSNLLAELQSAPCHWHPNGFAVFRVDDNHHLGNLRLHIWPASKRRLRADSPPIHTHVWHLCSRILTGTYSESIYGEVSTRAPGARRYSTADIHYTSDPNTFYGAEERNLRVVSTESIEAGGFHAIPAGIPHETLIDEHSFVATLLLTSPPQLREAHVYDVKRINATSYNRPPLTGPERSALLSHLRETIEKPYPQKNAPYIREGG